MRTLLHRLLLATLGALLSVSVLADVYRWVDDQGQVHYGDQSQQDRQRGYQSYRAETGSGGTSQSERMEKTRKLLDAYRAERQQDRDAAERIEQDRQKKQRNCARARDNVRRYEASGKIYQLSDSGERQYLSKSDMQTLRVRWRAQVKRWCDR